MKKVRIPLTFTEAYAVCSVPCAICALELLGVLFIIWTRLDVSPGFVHNAVSSVMGLYRISEVALIVALGVSALGYKMREKGQKWFYNIWMGMFEFHIDRETNLAVVGTSIRNIIIRARKEGKSIFTCTHLYSVERIEGMAKKWGCVVTARPVGLFRRVVYYIGYYTITLGLNRKESHYPLMQYVITPVSR